MLVQPQTNYVEVQAVAVGAWVGKGPIHQMKSICAGETTLGHVIMRVIIFAIIEVVFHGPHGTGLHTLSPPSKGHYYP
jgi:hypothetical protein